VITFAPGSTFSSRKERSVSAESVEDRAYATAPEALGLATLHGDGDEHFLALVSAATQARLLTADVGLIDLHRAL